MVPGALGFCQCPTAKQTMSAFMRWHYWKTKWEIDRKTTNTCPRVSGNTDRQTDEPTDRHTHTSMARIHKDSQSENDN